jgi:hypothetical protein
VVLDEPAVAEYTSWNQPAPASPAAGGQERGFDAPGTADVDLDLNPSADYELSLQYHSQVPLTVVYDGEPVAHLPPSLDGMYLSGAGRGAFWPAGKITAGDSGRVEVRAADPTGLQDALGVPRRVWLGDLAATPVAEPKAELMSDACGGYVDHFTLERGKKAGG